MEGGPSGAAGDVWELRGVYSRSCPSGRRCLRKPRDAERAKAWLEDPTCQDAVRRSIRLVLEQLYGESVEEVPLVGVLRKEVAGELLSSRAEDLAELPADLNLPNLAGDERFVVLPECRRLRRFDVLYAVEDLAERWRAMERRRQSRARQLEALVRRAGATPQDLVLAEQCRAALLEARTPQDLDDVDCMMRLLPSPSSTAAAEDFLAGLEIGAEDPDAAAAQQRRRKSGPKKVTLASLAREAGLGEVLDQIAAPAHQLGEALLFGHRGAEPPTPDQPLEELLGAVALQAQGFSDHEAVRRGLVALGALRVASDAGLRRFVRQHYLRYARLTTAPTPAGERGIDATSMYGHVKRLQAKPLTSVTAEDFARVVQAERDGLLTVTIELKDITKFRRVGSAFRVAGNAPFLWPFDLLDPN